MPRLKQKHKKTIVNVVNRWRESYAGVKPVNYERIRELINIAYSTKVTTKRTRTARNFTYKTVKLGPPKIHFVRSPVAFDIAQAVVRGRLSKEYAKCLCQNYGIKDDFITVLRRDSQTQSYGHHAYYQGGSTLLDLWRHTIEPALKDAKNVGFMMEDPNAPDANNETKRAFKKFAKDFPELPTLPVNPVTRAMQNNDLTITNGSRKLIGTKDVCVMPAIACQDPTQLANRELLTVPWSRNANAATLSRCKLAELNSWSSSYIDADVMRSLLDISDPKKTWAYELMHEAQLVMFFKSQVIVLAEQPKIHTNADGELHNDEGPAVAWNDGVKAYYIDGHALGWLGELIVDHPEKLTIDHINGEENEEVKRIAIDKYGWGRYFKDINAQVIDRRENAVDNTIEALVTVRSKRYRRTWQRAEQEAEEFNIEQRKLVLSCRSTARQYFLSVPETVRNCEGGQRWMAEGANTSRVAALARPVRVIGAS